MLPRSPHRFQLQVNIRRLLHNRYNDNVRARIRQHKFQMKRTTLQLISLRQKSPRIRRSHISLKSSFNVRRLIRLIMPSIIRPHPIARQHRSLPNNYRNYQVAIRASRPNTQRPQRRDHTITTRTNNNVRRSKLLDK